MQTEQAFFAVTANVANWSRDAIPASELERRGYVVRPSRLTGDASLFTADGLHLVAHLFTRKVDAARFVAAN